jgi:hypothetical protein
MHYAVIQPRHRLGLCGNNLVVDVRAESRPQHIMISYAFDRIRVLFESRRMRRVTMGGVLPLPKKLICKLQH